MTDTLQNDLYLRALLREPVERTPVWVMRQAGRYLPEYREIRAQAGDFMTLASNPELACEVTLQPLRRFALDAAIIFSDILTIPDAMGLGLSFAAGEGPQFASPVRSAKDIANLSLPDMNDLRYVMDAISLTRKELKGQVPLIGFSGSPWTLATYMIEGSSSKDYRYSRGMLHADPKSAHQLLDLLAKSVIEYLNTQIDSGAQAVMVFDTWGGILSPALYREFSLQYMEQIVAGLKREADGRKVPVVLFTKNGGAWLNEMANTGCDGLGVDWTTDLHTARQTIQDRVALQGNLDPTCLYADEETIRQNVDRVLSSYGQSNGKGGHVFNLGHGIQTGVNPDHLGYMVKAVHELSPKYHKEIKS